jgi:ParB/RepB/Spo0J family partition protein
MTEPASPDSVRVERVDPWEITVADENERTERLNSRDLEESIAERGVVQPPLVRPSDARAHDYEVFAGQRRVSAAQGTQDRIPVVVFNEFDDADALAASITENAEPLRESVSSRDRARALQQLWVAMGGDADEFPSVSELGDKLGIPDPTISRWLEPLREEWQGTPIAPDGEFHSETEDSFSPETIDEAGEATLAEVRKATGGGDEGAEVVRTAVERDLSREDTTEVAERVADGEATEEAVEAVRSATEEGSNSQSSQRQMTITLAEETYERLEEQAREHAMAEEQLAAELLRDAL